MSDPVRCAVNDELSRLEEDLLYTEKAHFAASDGDGRLHLIFGLVATIAAAAAAATVITDLNTWVPGVCALVATIASTILTFVKPDQRATQHLQCGRALGALRVRVRQARTIELVAQASVDVTTWATVVSDLGSQKAVIEETAPSTGEWTFRRARKKIGRGDFQHGSA